MAGKKGSLTDRKNKPRMSLIPKDAVWEIGKAFTYGESKYGSHNYKQGISISHLLDASIRHTLQFSNGEDFDEESEVLHLGCAMANLAMAIDMYYNNKKFDDRYKKEINALITKTDRIEQTNTTGKTEMIELLKGSTIIYPDGRKMTIETDGKFPVPPQAKVIF